MENQWIREQKNSFFITLVMSVLYVLLIRHIGFIILSTILLYGLEYIYATVGEKRNTRNYWVVEPLPL